MTTLWDNGSIFVAGHGGMVGRAVVRSLLRLGCPAERLLFAPREEVDLTDTVAVESFLSGKRVQTMIIAAAKVGGILANSTQPVDFLLTNLRIQNNLIQSAYRNKVDRVLFLGSSCIYPKYANQPIKESELLKGSLEPSNEPYALAKITGIKLCEAYNKQYGCDFRSVMPTNVYGPYDNFHPTASHVVPGLLSRFEEARLAGVDEVTIWGSGKPKREFIHVDDLADACLILLNMERDEYGKLIDAAGASHINIGTGSESSIAELAAMIKEVTGYLGEIQYDREKPDGTPRKLLDSSVLRSTGWAPQYSLQSGLRHTWSWFQENKSELRR